MRAGACGHPFHMQPKGKLRFRKGIGLRQKRDQNSRPPSRNVLVRALSFSKAPHPENVPVSQLNSSTGVIHPVALSQAAHEAPHEGLALPREFWAQTPRPEQAPHATATGEREPESLPPAPWASEGLCHPSAGQTLSSAPCYRCLEKPETCTMSQRKESKNLDRVCPDQALHGGRDRSGKGRRRHMVQEVPYVPTHGPQRGPHIKTANDIHSHRSRSDFR